MKSDTVLCDSKTCSKTQEQGVVGSLCACDAGVWGGAGFQSNISGYVQREEVKPGSKMIEFKTKMLSRQPETPGGLVFVYSTL